MFRFVVFAALIALAVADTFDHCLGGQLPEHIRIENCASPPCTINRGEELKIQVKFTLDRSVKALNTRVSALSHGSIFEYYLPEGSGNACNHLVGGASCPLTANELVTYNLNIPINGYLPDGYSALRVYSEDENYSLVSCFAFHVLVVDP